MDLDFSIDDARLMDFDTQFHDDSTSCSSSVSVPYGEDIDDLRLGAEANMFSPRLEDDINSKTTPVQNFVILKENSGDKTYSTISSIPDMIQAREGNPEDLLLQLGFASFEGEESHSSILSRFDTCPKQGREHPTQDQHGGNAQESDVVLDTRDSIIKTQEWLDNHQHVNDSPQFSHVSKEVSRGSKVVVGSAQNQGKRMAAQKKRSRWSKSRQSSFDLLPNLEEEETQPSVEIVGGLNAGQKDGKLVGPIRESSQEKEEPKWKPIQTAVVSMVRQPDMSAAEISEFDKHKDYHESRSNDNCESCSCSQVTTDQSSDLPDTSRTKQPESSNTLTGNVDKVVHYVDKLSRGANDPPLLHFAPLKRLNLLDMKVDSFELEEIVSNDGCASPNMPRSTKQSSTPIVPNHSATTGFLHYECDLDSKAKKPSSSLASSDSSSGFDEGLEDTTPYIARQNSTSSVEEMQHEDEISFHATVLLCWANDMSRSICQFGICKYVDILQQRLRDFCAMKSKILCASAIAEFALLKGKERRKLKRLEFTTCPSLHPSNRTSSFSRPCNSGDIYSSEKDGALTSNGQRCASMQCDYDKDNQSQGCPVQKSKPEACLHHRKHQWQAPLASLSSPNTDNANDSNNSTTNERGRRLVRFSSIASLHLQSSQRYRKSPCQDYLSGGSALRNSHSSLMSSVSDVTYLSYRSASWPSDWQMRCEKQYGKPNGMRDCSDKRHQNHTPETLVDNTELYLTISCKCSVGSAPCLGSPDHSANDIFSEDDTEGAQNVAAFSRKYKNHKSKRDVCVTDMMRQSSFEDQS